MEEKPEMLQLYELQYSDLILLSSDESPSSPEEIRRQESVSETVMQNLGPKGPGLLSIVGVPQASVLRQALLPLARKLALLNNDDRKRVLKEHNLGSDVPLKDLDRVVSSFAMQMKYEQTTSNGVNNNEIKTEFEYREFKNLGILFKELGFCMMELGLCLARICDKIIGGHELEDSLLQSGTAKGRLIHYHSCIDNLVIKQLAKKKGGRNKEINLGNEAKLSDDKLDLWQKWHYDYGIFTILTNPMFMLSDANNEIEREYISDHTYLQILDPEKNCVAMVKASTGSFIVQVGESADILSKGKLKATLHCVCRPKKMENLSRETFVIFLQPAWNKTFHLSDYPIDQDSELYSQGTHGVAKDSSELTQSIRRLVPQLHSRLRDGMTFAEFSRETTKQYYGSSGLQSNR